ncbi:hypothetical protein V1514DRAFT_300594 [Lipomyces japonicus]|uniref:uncharacterized protein n=1 Tax=Lipomyces japonicus TaxID=56871 RepID=UPI0034CD51F9
MVDDNFAVAFVSPAEHDVRKFKRTFPYAELLPYETEQDDLRHQHLSHILENLFISASTESFALAQILHWTRALRSYLELKFDLPVSVRTRLVALYYELALAQGLDPLAFDRFYSMFVLLIDKRHLIDLDLITLDWKLLLHEHLKNFDYSSPASGVRMSEKDPRKLANIGAYARRFFEPESISGILEQFLPLFNNIKTQAAIDVAEVLKSMIRIEPVPEQYPHLYHQRWLPSIFHLWALYTRSSQFDYIMISMMSRQAFGALPASHISFSSTGIFTKEQTATMFTAALRLIEVPVGSSGSPYLSKASVSLGSYKDRKKSRCARPIALWIIYSLAPESLTDSASVLNGLKGFIQSVETFFHPSNAGTWTIHLTQLLSHLTSYFVHRWNQERSGELDVAPERQLNHELKREIVYTLKDVVLMGIHSKSGTAAAHALSALQDLAFLEPDIILPLVLKQTYPSLQGLVETHRTITSFKTLRLLARSIIQSKRTRVHVTALLGLAVPGIDANDLSKTVQALTFIRAVASYVPFADLSENSGPGVAMEYITNAIEALESNQEEILGELSAEDELMVLKSSTATFGDFITAFIGRIFSLLENLPDESNNRQRALPEANVVNAMTPAFQVVLSALSEDLYDIALQRIVDFVSNHIIQQATDVMGNLVSALVKVNPEKAFAKLFPVLTGNIREEIEENRAGSTRSADILPRDRALVWYLTLLRKVTWDSGPILLKYKSELLSIIQLLRDNCRGRVSTHACNLIHHVLCTLTRISANDSRIINSDEYHARGYTIDDWGKQYKPEELKILWHVPSAEELDFAIEVFLNHSEQSISGLDKAISESSDHNRSKEWSDDLQKDLSYLRVLASGISLLLDRRDNEHDETGKSEGDVEMQNVSDNVDRGILDDVEEDLIDDEESAGDDDNDDSEESSAIRKVYRYPSGYPFQDKSNPLYIKIHETHQRFGQILHRVYLYLQEHKEDDVPSFETLAYAYRIWFTDVGNEQSLKLAATHIRSYVHEIEIYKTRGLRKLYPRHLLVSRAYIYHLQRVKENCGIRRMTLLEKTLLLDLLGASLSNYTNIRRQAQFSLDSASHFLSGSRAFLVPKLIEELQKAINANEFDRVKGAIFTVNSRALQRFSIRDPRFAPDLVHALVEACKADKVSVNNLARQLIVQFAITPRYSLKSIYYSDDFASKVLNAIRPDTDVSERIKKLSEKLERKHTELFEKFDQLENELIKQEESGEHWKIEILLNSLVISGFKVSRDTLPFDAARVMARGAINPHPHLRYSFMQGFLQILLITYVRSLGGYDIRRIVTEDFVDYNEIKISVNSQDEAFTKQFLEDLKVPNPPYLLPLNGFPGWLAWGTTFKAEKYVVDVLPLFSEGSENLLRAMGSEINKDWLQSLFNLYTQEPRQELDGFTSVHAIFVSSVFMLIYSGRAAVSFEDAAEIIQALYGDGEDKNRHRATAEVLAGALTSHGDTEHIKKIARFAIDIFKNAVLDKITPENLGYWTGFVSYVFARIDSRLLWPFVEFLTSFRLDVTSNAAFKESSKFSLLRVFIGQLSWKFQNEEQIEQDLLSHLDHGYKGVREEIGKTLGNIFKSRYYEAFKNVQSYIEANNDAGSLGVVPFQRTQRLDDILDSTFKQLSVWKAERQPLQETSSYTNASKTILIWFDTWIQSPNYVELLPYFAGTILPTLLNLLDVKEDTEVISLAVSLFKSFSNVPYPPHILPDIIGAVAKIFSTSETWHQRLRVLAVVQVLYFRQLFQLSDKNRKHLFDCVSNLLYDPQLEVRDSAATTLSGMIRCSPVAFRNQIIKKLQKVFENKLHDNPLPVHPNRVAALSASSLDSSPRVGTPSAEYNQIVITRHAAVLGLSALVQAFPYQSPPPIWIPSVLATLAIKAANDPGMVGRSVKTALGEFKKTRQDTWHVDSKVFTSDQLEDLEGVLWRSYFA